MNNIYIEKKIRERKFLEIIYREKLRVDICTEWSNYKKYLYKLKISSGNNLKKLYLKDGAEKIPYKLYSHKYLIRKL